MLQGYGIKAMLLESKSTKARQFTGEPGRGPRRQQDIQKIKYFRAQCAAYNQLEKRLGAGFIFALPEGIWSERE
jgi:hypothetical protein